MKKLLLVLAIVISGLTNSIKAQDIDFGLKAGLNLSNLVGSDVNANSLLGFHIGAFAEIGFSEKFSFQPELLYSKQGSELEGLLKIKVDYLSIPLIAKYYVSEKFSIEAGPQLGFLVNDVIEFEDDSMDNEDSDAASFDLGISLGFGLKLSSKLFAQLRYNYGITAVTENQDVNNSVFQVSLGYKF